MSTEPRAARGGAGLVSDEVRLRRAASQDELQQAYGLVYRSYRDQGYVDKHPNRIRVSIFNAFPATVTFVGLVYPKVVATLTLVPDTAVGLPMDEIYHEEVEELRTAGRRLAEVTMLADRRHELRRSLPVLLTLMKRMFDYATLVLGANDLCITINPRHESYYRRYLLFESLGELKLYPSVRDNPAIALRLDLDKFRQRCRGNQRLLNRFFTDRTSVETLCSGYFMDADDLEHFFVESTSVFREAPAEQIDRLRVLYPHCPWDRWMGEE